MVKGTLEQIRRAVVALERIADALDYFKALQIGVQERRRAPDAQPPASANTNEHTSPATSNGESS